MDVSNSSGQSTQYSVKGTGGGTAPVPGKKSRPKRNLSRKLSKGIFERVEPPAGTSWIIEFYTEDGGLLASATIDDPECLVVLVQEKDGSFKVHVSRSAEPALTKGAPVGSPPQKMSA